MPEVLGQRLVRLGLLDQRRIERHRPLQEHIDTFKDVVAGRKTNSEKHAERQARMVTLLTSVMKVADFAQITEDEVSIALGKMNRAVATRRAYVVAIKDFAKWMVKSRRATNNPVADLKPPGQYSDPTIERVPLTVPQFQSLMRYLDGFSRYPHQLTRWTAHDRKMIYWTAVQTAFRQGELRSLRVRSLRLDAVPPQVDIRAGDAKNRTKGSVPIPQDLAHALRDYVKGRDDEKLFPFPCSAGSIVDALRRDLDGAGIQWNFGEDNPETIDFHTLRSTAITWWLDVIGLPAKRVQVLARLKALALVAAYSRNMRLDEHAWLMTVPRLVDPPEQMAI